MASAVPDDDAALQGRDLQAIFRLWEEKHTTSGFDPVPILTRLSEIFEDETEIYMRKDPDPFDERHPSRTDPECELGRMLKLLFRKDHFMTRLVNDYLRDNFFTRQSIQKSSQPLNIAACRLILVIMPGLETSAVFQAENDNLNQRLYNWAENSEEPLQSYATGLLGAAMEVQDIAVGFREHNTRLVPFMLKRLHQLQTEARGLPGKLVDTPKVNGLTSTGGSSKSIDVPCAVAAPSENATVKSERPFAHLGGGSVPSSPDTTAPVKSSSLTTKFRKTINLSTLSESSQQSSDCKYIRYTIPIYPATLETSQMLTLRYLTSMGEYQEFLGQVFEHNAMQLIFGYIENLDPKNTCLAFEALKYLASLLCHKKFSLEFISTGGLERLMKVPRPSVSATGVSIALYYLAYCEDAMERICLMPQSFVSEVVSYALWLLSSAHDSGRCHATMFFGLSFQFKIILDEFDKQDGLRKLCNVISVLPIVQPTYNEDNNLNDDEECAARQMVRHVCVALKRYMESHLFYKYTQASRLNEASTIPVQPIFRAPKCTPEVISDQVTGLQEMFPIHAPWDPVDKLLKLGGIPLLLRIIAFSYEWNYSGSFSSRAETVRSALDVLSICCVLPSVHVVFCERMQLPDEASAAGINIILGAAEGEIVADPEVQKSALYVLVHCVCAPICKQPTVHRVGSAKKKTPYKYTSDQINQVWDSVRSNNGIIVLLQLMEVKLPITDADCIRGLACRALAGLARSETVKQIISKLPIFANNLLQSLMRDPILQEKRTEHVQFQKYALELMERVSGKSKASNQLDTSLANIHKANVVAQTKIQFNEQQLFELINEHLVSRGLSETAAVLQREANLQMPPPAKPTPSYHSPFSFRTPNTPSVRSRIRSKPSDLNAALNALDLAPNITNNITNNNNVGSTSSLANGGVAQMDLDAEPSITTPIKLIKKSQSASQIANTAQQHQQQPPNQPNRSLQKQISAIEASEPTYLGPAVRSQPNIAPPAKAITLETIITEYLTNQHALCKNPMSTCPQFDLVLPHKCPDPRASRVSGLSHNFAARYFRQQAGFNSRRLDRRLIHSNFCVARTIRPEDPDYFFTCCDIAPCATSVAVGSYSGDVKVYNINETGEEFSYHCHESFVNSIKCSRDGNFVVTSCAWRSPLSALWNIENRQFIMKLSWDEEEYMEFANIANDRILGTKSEVATIYDLNTGQKVSSFTPQIFNQYSKNRATYYPTDELILSDGVLWDVKSGREIHKFDKLNQAISGVFHPNGLEVVSNTEVWDLRTFHLLRTVPALDQCQLTFSPQNVIYGISPEVENRLDFEQINYSYESSFKTLDAYDYASIATFDVKRNIYDLSINKYGSQIAVVENQGGYDSVQESAVRIYSVGRKKNAEDETEEDDDDAISDEASMSDADSVVMRNGDNIGGDNNDDDDDNDGGDDDSDDDDEDVEEWLNGSSSSEVNIFELNSGSDNDDLEGEVNDGSDVSMSWTTDDEDGAD